MSTSELRAAWPFAWDFAGSSDEPMAAALGPEGDLWVLTESHRPGVAMPRAVLLRISAGGDVLWATEETALPFPTALALRPDGSALAVGRDDAGLVATAFEPSGAIAWSRSRAGTPIDHPFTGPHVSPIWDPTAASSGAWRIPTGLGGDFAVLSFEADGDALADIVWSPPAGTGRATSLLPRPGGGLYVGGMVEDVPPPGWWTVALDTAGAEVWKNFEFGNTNPGIFSGAFLLSGEESGDPVRVWADDETGCGLFSLRLWSLDAATGAPLWAATWPTTGAIPACDSFTPTNAVLEGGRILVSGTGNVDGVAANFDPIALSFEAETGATVWERTFAGAKVGIRADVTSVGGSALVASTLFPEPNPGPTPLWLSSWDRDGDACLAPSELLPARVQASVVTADGHRLLVGYGFNFAGPTNDDLLIQRVADPCAALFADGFASGDTDRWSETAPRP